MRSRGQLGTHSSHSIVIPRTLTCSLEASWKKSKGNSFCCRDSAFTFVDRFQDGVTGRTFNCINSKQFRALKDGDRFFFTHTNGANPFNSAQLSNLRNRRLSDIICDNSDIKSVRSLVFKTDSDEMCCSSRNSLDIDLFVNSRP